MYIYNKTYTFLLFHIMGNVICCYPTDFENTTLTTRTRYMYMRDHDEPQYSFSNAMKYYPESDDEFDDVRL